MSYVYRVDIEAEIDAEHLLAALDDDKDGAEDEGLFTELAASIDALIGGKMDMISAVSLPTPPVTFLRTCGRFMMCSLLMRRRGLSDESNPFAESAKDLMDQLTSIANGEQSVVPKTLSIITTETTLNRFIETEAESSTTSGSSAVTLTAPDGTVYEMKIKYVSGVVTHYWEEVA